MKNYLLIIFFLTGIIAGIPIQSFAQQSATALKTRQAFFDLSTGDVYKFTATYVYPMRGPSRNLTPDYTMIFSKDTLNGRLPYFGVATSVNYGSRDCGVNLETNSFTYTQTIDKKGTCVIKYQLKSSNDIMNITFSIYKEGKADLSVNFLQREGISYRGVIEKIALP
ncbi:DUF4251 domain-containing protein [Taibaiella lutea]|uniref:DUF4251 domain-containing protein n=1 Tax=Taibaiella lutea TaxID=2608001 RepID=A0A5M6CGW6_9BACT|nr:DUF4251 domain-containing protein [Taibaiella lutea]KAA5534444.1 DUF4251 domain-containing protein [Taibaiella lutea]